MENIDDKFLNRIMKEPVVSADSDFVNKVMEKIELETSTTQKKGFIKTIEFQSFVALFLGIIVYGFTNPDFPKIIFQSFIKMTDSPYFSQILTFLSAFIFLVIADIIIRKSKPKYFLAL